MSSKRAECRSEGPVNLTVRGSDHNRPGQMTACSVCTQDLHEPFGWCENCRAAFCAECGAAHYCMPSCKEAGCHAGLCVRLVRDGAIVPNSWGMRE